MMSLSMVQWETPRQIEGHVVVSEGAKCPCGVGECKDLLFKGIRRCPEWLHWRLTGGGTLLLPTNVKRTLRGTSSKGGLA
jgi:hypothetical protein